MDRDRANAVLTSYNHIFSEVFDRYIEGMSSSKNFADIFYDNDLLADLTGKKIAVWERNPLDDLEGQTPEAYFQGIDTLDDLLEIFKAAVFIVDEELPELLVKRLESFGSRAWDAMLEFALDRQMTDSDTDYIVPVKAAQLLGKWKIEKCTDHFIDRMYELTEENEPVIEAYAGALSEIGRAALEKVVQRLDQATGIHSIEEKLMSILVYAQEGKVSDSVFRCLKGVFRKMEDKRLGALYLGDYGDGRAIPLLRGFVEKNRDTLDPETYYAVKSAIEHLGGNTDDLEM